ncbi:MAG: GNAT family N-acetyltransferase [Alphaproteobacteria bacterium]|nr:GNAT family N-acetyltransferase [Alphaproteobacteria bacterium]
MNEERTDAAVAPTVARLAESPEIADFSKQLDDIFFTSSATKSFASDDERRAFRWRWLGRYLDADSDWFYVAVSGNRLVGYLAGAIDDPAQSGRFKDIAYFTEISAETGKYPAHLHVNVVEGFRSGGVGSRLIERFVSDLRAANIRGVHLVTGRHSRNIPFYLKNGFVPVKNITCGASESIMLGRPLNRG